MSLRLLGALLALVPGLGCSGMVRANVGPALVHPDEHTTSYGVDSRLGLGVGNSDGEELVLAELDTRLLVAEQTQAIGVGLGPTYVRWLGPSALTLRLTPGLGLERFDGKAFFNASLRGGLGTGIVLREKKRVAPSFGLPAMRGPHDPTYYERKRVVLTLELTGGADARMTREPLLTAGILVGVASVAERYELY